MWDVQGNYGNEWEAVFAAETLDEARSIAKDYRSNEPSTRFRVRRCKDDA